MLFSLLLYLKISVTFLGIFVKGFLSHKVILAFFAKGVSVAAKSASFAPTSSLSPRSWFLGEFSNAIFDISCAADSLAALFVSFLALPQTNIASRGLTGISVPPFPSNSVLQSAA
uniref:Secreted protein n=1 Tax=Pyxicephalus adspersus TaxID=30357 RepID=A0AAV3A3J2_PYXAD|nr:TPA: hypothetical protein GDO54_017857 [Pyxicephalus adspersus]